MNLKDLKKELNEAVDNNTLLTGKHDPNNLSLIMKDFRSVISHEVSSSLSAFIKSGNYTVHEYENQNPKHVPYYMKIIPGSGTTFNVAGSGITSYSTIPSSVLDTLIVVSGSNIGWHIFAENQSDINNKVVSGYLMDKGQLL